MEINKLYGIFLENPVISTDSRKILPDSIFFALKGENYDGNSFASEAIEKGAAFVVMDNPEFECKSEKCILVNDSLSTLQALASFHRKNLGAKLIAITGSNGKTTTKELMASVLRKKFLTHATPGNLNNHIGLPLTLLNMDTEAEFAVVEMGANHPGEIDRLCNIADPDIGLITNIGKAHLEGFGGFDGVVKAKTELYGYIKKKGGKILINNDNEILRSLSKGIEKITYGQSGKNFCIGKATGYFPFLSLDFFFNGSWYPVNTNLTGKYNTENILAAICTGLYFGVDPTAVREAIESFVPSNNRSQIINTGANSVLLDAYNANPSSMKLSIENFRDYPAENKIAILGDMLELGEKAEEEHLIVVNLALNAGFSGIILVGSCFSGIARRKNIPHFYTTEELNEWLKMNPVKNSIILLKGSRKMKLETIVKNL